MKAEVDLTREQAISIMETALKGHFDITLHMTPSAPDVITVDIKGCIHEVVTLLAQEFRC